MKKLSLGWLVWLNEENMSRRIDMVTQSANSLGILSQDAYQLLIINNGGLKELPFKLPAAAKHIILEENFIDISAYYVPYLHAIENNNPYFGFLYDDFIVYKDAVRDCIEFLDNNPQISCIRLPEYVTGDKKYNTTYVNKSVNPDAVGHLEGAGNTKLQQIGPVKVGENSFYISNWRPNSRPTIWRTESYSNFCNLKDSNHFVMQPYEAKLYSTADKLAVEGKYLSGYLEGGMCRTFSVTTSERTRSSSNFWLNYTVDVPKLVENYRKS